MSMFPYEILEDINKMNPIDKLDFMEDYCERYGCADTDRAEELKNREDILVIAIKMLTDKSTMGEFQNYIARSADKWFVDDLLAELGALCKEDYRFE